MKVTKNVCDWCARETAFFAGALMCSQIAGSAFGMDLCPPCLKEISADMEKRRNLAREAVKTLCGVVVTERAEKEKP